MLWYKAWHDTRWRFVIGLGILVMAACGAVLQYPATAHLLHSAQTMSTSSDIMGRVVHEAIATQHDYRGFVWWQWFRESFAHLWTLFAVLLGSGGLIGSRAAMFTMSLPIRRRRVIAVRAIAGFAELLVLAIVPSLMIPLLSPAIGQSYPIGDALVHGACMTLGGACFFSLALLLSTSFEDVWRPALITCGVAVALAVLEIFLHDAGAHGLFAAMSGETYFRSGGLPWAGLVISVATSSVFVYAASEAFARLDF